MSSFESGKRAPDSHTSYARGEASVTRSAALSASVHHHNLRRCGVGLLVCLLVALTSALPLFLGGCDDSPAVMTLGPTISVTLSTTSSTTTSTTAEAHGSRVRMPNLFGLYLDEAEDVLSPLGLTYEVVHEQWATAGSSDNYNIYEQDIAPGTMVAVGSSVGVSIWRWGSQVPDVVGMTRAAAIARLDSYLFLANVVYAPVVDTAKIGRVLSQDPAAGTGFELDEILGPDADHRYVTITVGKLLDLEPDLPTPLPFELPPVIPMP